MPIRNPRRHIALPQQLSTAPPFVPITNAFGKSGPIPQDRQAHSAKLRGDLATATLEAVDARERQEEFGWDTGFGMMVRFSIFPGIDFSTDPLDRVSDGIELLISNEGGDHPYAVAWVPDGKLAVLEKKIVDYLARKTDKNGKPLDSQAFIDAISEIRAAVVEDLWTGSAPIPEDDALLRLEAWIGAPHAPSGRRKNNLAETLKSRLGRFRATATLLKIKVSERELCFPERAVVQITATLKDLKSSIDLLGQLAELRPAPSAPEFFMRQNRADQALWTHDALDRTTFAGAEQDPPYVCILDTGCTHAHPLLAPAISATDNHRLNEAWSENDDVGHGTEQCGVALWGDLASTLESSSQQHIPYRLESIKLIPEDASSYNEHFGYATAQAISLPEIGNPDRARVFSLALTSTESTNQGRPSAWSAEVDSLTSDWANDGERTRLVVVSGGNINPIPANTYHSLNSDTGIEDPAQSWNALTVGAVTHKVVITETYAGAYHPVASGGQLSPFSTTSNSWERTLPFKPDVVFEGGNMGNDGTLASRFDSLSLLTTSHRPTDTYFSTTEATSAACALASGFAARLRAQYPDLRPETIRGLIVHSANWTDSLLAQFPGTSHEAVERRLRHCGWGEPNLDAALNSGSDSFSLIAESEITPYEKKKGSSTASSKEMRIHRLPWPDALGDLLNSEVEVRVTLSYYVEPNPGERGRNNRFSYASHGLRFDLRKPAESLDAFKARINKATPLDDDEDDITSPGTQNWMLGKRRRFRGSLHHDRFKCTAAELASAQHIAVYPVGGWWKTRTAQQRFERTAKYSLIVSLSCPTLPQTIDLYTEISQKIAVEVATIVEI